MTLQEEATHDVGRIRRTWLTAVSIVVWRLPGWPVRFVTSFRDSEHGSAVDVLAAAEATTRRDMRRKYFRHAMDELRHAALFEARARALGGVGRDRARAALDDVGAVQHHGTLDGVTLFERLGEAGVLAFVHVAEADAIEQFGVYLDHRLPDPDTRATLSTILADEHFHRSYTAAALARMNAEGARVDVAAEFRRVRWRRFREAGSRLSRAFGATLARVWLTLLYLVAVAPFRLFARAEPGGWTAPRSEPRGVLPAARSQG